MGVGCHFYALAALPPRKGPHLGKNKRLGGLQGRPGRSAEEKISCDSQKSNKHSTVVQIVVWLLYRLRCPDFLMRMSRTTK